MKCYLLLDRTGSMSDKWSETLSAVNGYVRDLAKENIDADVTLAMFDKQNGFQFDVIRRSVALKDWQPVAETEAFPRGWTPLYDAVGQIAGLAQKDNPDKAMIVVMTDGEENSSTEVSREQARAALDLCRQKNWQVVFLGVAFDNFGQSHALGLSAGQTLAASRGALREMGGVAAAVSSDYARTGAPRVFSAEERRSVRESDVTGRK